MALKKSRPIIVRDRPFRWKFKGHKDNLTRYGASPQFAHIAIQEDAENPGKPMVAHVESAVFVDHETHDGDTGHIDHKARFTPGAVRVLIEACLDAGWDPSSKEAFTAPTGLYLSDYKTVAR